jgi:hypothetical protein
VSGSPPHPHAHKHSPASPPHKAHTEDKDEEEDREEEALPCVVFQDEVTVAVEGSDTGVALSVTVYEEEGQGGHTQLLVSCVAEEEVGWEPGHWKVLVTEAHVGMSPGALREMGRGAKGRLASRVVAKGLRMGGSRGARFLYLDAAAAAQAAASH